MPRYTNDAAFTKGVANLAELMFGNPLKQARADLWQSQMTENEAQAEMARQHGDLFGAQANDQIQRTGTALRYATPGETTYDPVYGQAYGLGETNVDRLYKARQQDAETSAYKGALDGTMSTQKYAGVQAAQKGELPFAVQGDTLVNRYSGDMTTTDLGQAKIGTERAHAGEYQAQAGMYGAQAGKYKQETKNITPGADGMTPADISKESATGKYNPKGGGAGAAGEKPLTTMDVLRAKTAVDKAFPGLSNQYNMDDATKMAVAARAQKYVAENKIAPEDALTMALDELTASGDVARKDPHFFGNPSLSYTAKPSAAAAPIAQTQGAQHSTPAAVPAPAQRKAGSVYQTPKGPMKWTGTGWLPA